MSPNSLPNLSGFPPKSLHDVEIFKNNILDGAKRMGQKIDLLKGEPHEKDKGYCGKYIGNDLKRT